MKRGFLMAILYVLSGFVLHARADDAAPLQDRFAVRGFGTLGGSCFSADDNDFIRDKRPDGPGQTRRCDAKLDTVLGLQVDANLSDGLEATLQGISYHNADNNFSPELSLANLRWSASENVAVRVGRMQSPMFLVSEYRNIHYLQPWARPAREIYNLATIYSVDGGEIQHRSKVLDWGLSISLGFGRSKFNVRRDDGTYQTDPITSDLGYLNAVLTRDNWLFKSSLLTGKVSYTSPAIDSVMGVLKSYGYGALTDKLAMDKSNLFLAGLSVKYETNDWLLQSEYAYRHIDSFYSDQESGYVLAGKRWGEWMTYGLLGRRLSHVSEIKNTAPGVLGRYVDQLLLIGQESYTTYALGVSRRLSENWMLKVQMDTIYPDEKSKKAGFMSGNERLITLNLDFLF